MHAILLHVVKGQFLASNEGRDMLSVLQRGNESAAAEYKQRLADVWKKYDANPFTNMLGGLAQAPIFIGFFSAIRAMAGAKVRSGKTSRWTFSASIYLHYKCVRKELFTSCSCSEQSSCKASCLSCESVIQITSINVGGALWGTDLSLARLYYLLPNTALSQWLRATQLPRQATQAVKLQFRFRP